MIPDYEQAALDIKQLMQDHKLSIVSVFVPYSRSRSYKPQAKMHEKSLNWQVTLMVDGRPVFTTDYSAGIAHTPAYSYKQFGSANSDDRMQAINIEIETGHKARQTSYGPIKTMGQELKIDPQPVDVLSALLNDGRAVDYRSFEDWTSEYGYDIDSRTAHKTYKQCLKCGLAIRAVLGNTLFDQLADLSGRL